MSTIDDTEYTYGFIQGHHNGLLKGISFSDGSSEEEEVPDWQPPDDWIAVPEPNDNEAYFLINTIINQMWIASASISWVAYNVLYAIIDWGDGTTSNLRVREDGSEDTSATHTYSEKKQYLVKITSIYMNSGTKAEQLDYEYILFYANNINYNMSGMLIVKYGDKYPIYASDGEYYGDEYHEDYNNRIACYDHQLSHYGTGLCYIKFPANFTMQDYLFLPNVYKHYHNTSYLKFRNYYLEIIFPFNIYVLIPPKHYNMSFQSLQSCNRLQHYSFPDNLTKIPDTCFLNCTGLKSVDNLSQMTIIGYNIFGNCQSLKKIELLNMTTFTIESTYQKGYVFQNCYKLQEVNLPICIDIEQYCFYNCISLTKVNLPCVTELKQYAFDNCINIEKIKLPSCTKVESNAFTGCCSLKELYLPKCTEIVGTSVIMYAYNLTKITLAKGCVFNKDIFQYCNLLTIEYV